MTSSKISVVAIFGKITKRKMMANVVLALRKFNGTEDFSLSFCDMEQIDTRPTKLNCVTIEMNREQVEALAKTFSEYLNENYNTINHGREKIS